VRYTVYFDNPTHNHFVLEKGFMWSVDARTTTESFPANRTRVDHGVLIPNCEVVDWHWQCSGPNGWGEHTYPSEARAAEALSRAAAADDPAACKTHQTVV